MGPVVTPTCGDIYYHPGKGGTVKGCGRELAIVPDLDGKGHTIVCPTCDWLGLWPSEKLRDERKAA